MELEGAKKFIKDFQYGAGSSLDEAYEITITEEISEWRQANMSYKEIQDELMKQLISDSKHLNSSSNPFYNLMIQTKVSVLTRMISCVCRSQV